MAGGFVLKPVHCASHRTLGRGNIPITHQSAGDDAWLVMQGQHRMDASGHSSDLLRKLDSQVWGFPWCCCPGHCASLSWGSWVSLVTEQGGKGEQGFEAEDSNDTGR